jgi:hypothetical protein
MEANMFQHILVIAAFSVIASANFDCKNPTKLLLKVNAKVNAMIEDLATIRPDKIEKELIGIKKNLVKFNEGYEDELACLANNPDVDKEELEIVKFRLVLIQRATQNPGELNKVLTELLNGQFDETDPDDIYTTRVHNHFRFLNEGKEKIFVMMFSKRLVRQTALFTFLTLSGSRIAWAMRSPQLLSLSDWDFDLHAKSKKSPMLWDFQVL